MVEATQSDKASEDFTKFDIVRFENYSKICAENKEQMGSLDFANLLDETIRLLGSFGNILSMAFSGKFG